MAHLVEIAFKGNRKEFFLWEGEDPLRVHAPVIVEADRGEDLGRVNSAGELAARRCGGCAHGCGEDAPTKRVLRTATGDDERRAADLRTQDEEARRRAMEQVKRHGLVMKVSDAEWQWDRRKLTVYFTAEQRVDFRALVRDLAALFRTRIELRQIGARDEAKRLDGVGRCGRQYCCSSWLPELTPVSLSLAKDQRLSLNPSQISGGCGRLLCCLRYEHEFYVASRKRFPKEGKLVHTALGEERVQAVDIFRERVLLRAGDGSSRVLALADLKAEIAARGGEAIEPAPPPPPASLVTFDEATTPPGSEAAAEAVSPPRRRRRRRRRRARNRPPTPPAAGPEAAAEPDEPAEEPPGE